MHSHAAEADPYQGQPYRFGLLKDFDHLYRYSVMLERLEGEDLNNILQGYADIVPRRATVDEHRHPLDDLRNPYERADSYLLTKMQVRVLEILYSRRSSSRPNSSHISAYG